MKNSQIMSNQRETWKSLGAAIRLLPYQRNDTTIHDLADDQLTSLNLHSPPCDLPWAAIGQMPPLLGSWWTAWGSSWANWGTHLTPSDLPQILCDLPQVPCDLPQLSSETPSNPSEPSTDLPEPPSYLLEPPNYLFEPQVTTPWAPLWAPKDFFDPLTDLREPPSDFP